MNQVNVETVRKEEIFLLVGDFPGKAHGARCVRSG